MPLELFPASRSMERGKRKRGDDDVESPKDLEAGGGKGAETASASDEEVEEFFAILRRLHAATKYIEKIDGASRLLMGKRSKPPPSDTDTKPCDEVGFGGKKTREHTVDTSLDLDLNLEPASIESDEKERRSRSQHPKPSSAGADSRK